MAASSALLFVIREMKLREMFRMDFKAGMFFYALAFLLGVLVTQQLSVLPAYGFLLVLLLSSVLLLLLFNRAILWAISRAIPRAIPREIMSSDHPEYRSYLTLISVFIFLIIIGFIYASVYAKSELEHRLDKSYIGKSFIIEGRVASLPSATGKVQRFEFDIDSYRLKGSAGSASGIATEQTSDPALAGKFPQRVRLSWYYGKQVNAGETWRLQVRLKPPHGFMNPGGFDYEAWLFQHGIHATGYVRKSQDNQKLSSSPPWSVNSHRQYIALQIDRLVEKSTAADNQSYSLVKALAIGDKSSITPQQWQVLAQTGTSHLMAISGLHIGLASLFAYVLVRRLLPAKVMLYMPAQHISLIAGLMTALLYALLAGLSIPTQRAIIMLSALSLTVLIKRNIRPLDSLGFALILVLLFDPTAVLSAGFWFSFSAVAVIFISVIRAEKLVEPSWLKKLLMIMWQWIRLQLIISVFLLPLSLYMFQQGSLVSPLANLLLIPYVSFLVVPLILLAIVATYIYHDAASLLFELAAALLDMIWPFLQYLSQLPNAYWVKGDVSLLDCLLATLAMLIIFFAGRLSSRSMKADSANRFATWSLRFVAAVLFIPLSLSNSWSDQMAEGDIHLLVLDVGQGSAAVVQTKNHVLVFDTGAKFSDKLNAGSGVIMPYLRSENIQKIDRLVISHGDSDHIGGAQVLLDAYPDLLLIGQDLENLQVKIDSGDNKRSCHAGMKWLWDEVLFEFLSPVSGEVLQVKHKAKKRNNHSCVLRISSSAGSVLFTGDIEKKIEKKLILDEESKLPSDILIVAHHGSNTSSGSAFIAAVNPELSIISAGYKNRYKLPSAKAVERYRRLDKQLMNTADKGAISIRLLADGMGHAMKHEGSSIMTVRSYRQEAEKYWNHRDF